MALSSGFLRDYSRWAKFDWLPVHAAILTIGEFPTAIEENCQPPIPADKEERYEWITKLIDTAINRGELQKPINPKSYAIWAAKYRVDVPEELLAQVELNYGSSDSGELDIRSETTLLNIIGALLELMLGDMTNGEPNSTFRNQEGIIEAILEKYEGRYGLSQRNLRKKFPIARQSLVASE